MSLSITRSADRRWQGRVSLEVELTWSGDNTFFTGFSNDISQGGVFIAAAEGEPPARHLALNLHLPDGEPPIEVAGEVRWVRQEAREHIGPRGFGVRFEELDAGQRRRIDAFIQRKAPIIGDI